MEAQGHLYSRSVTEDILVTTWLKVLNCVVGAPKRLINPAPPPPTSSETLSLSPLSLSLPLSHHPAVTKPSSHLWHITMGNTNGKLMPTTLGKGIFNSHWWGWTTWITRSPSYVGWQIWWMQSFQLNTLTQFIFLRRRRILQLLGHVCFWQFMLLVFWKHV